MLNIPDSVKALYKQDGVRKNFRAHFPGGELPDITNDNIVQESVKFTESICSQDVFKFGLTEASVIEFETVGVANMYGMTIECSSEIDCSSLSAAEIAEIEAGTWDGEFVPLADSDLGYAFFRVPYGVFRVEFCPRDHQAMAHRRVTAYTPSLKDVDSFYETKKMRLLTTAPDYEPDIDSVFWSTVLDSHPDALTDYGYSKQTAYIKTIISTWTPIQVRHVTITKPGRSGYLFLVADVAISLRNFAPDEYKRTLVSVPGVGQDGTFPSIDSIKSQLVSALETGIRNTEYFYDYDPANDGYDSFEAIVDAMILANPERYNARIPLMPFIEYHFVNNDSPYDQYIPIPANKLIYPAYPFKSTTNPTIRVYTIGGFHFELQSFRSEEIEGVFYDSFPNIMNIFTTETPSALPTLKVNSTLETKWRSTKVRSFANAYSIMDLVKGYLELNALFLSSSRLGGNRLLRISDISPVTVPPSDYSQMWFDEYDVEPIGTVRYSFTDEAGEEQVSEYNFGNGASVYDMSDNALLKNIGASPDVIESMLDTYFIPHLAPINFTPIDLEMKGLPYIEAGDALAVTAQDGTVCNSYALRRELDGVQSLTDQIDSESGLIIDSEEGGT